MDISTAMYRISSRIDTAPYGAAFVVSDFIDIADYETAKKTIARLAKKGIIRRVIRGIYDKPKYSTLLQEYAEPNPDSIAHAIARSNNWSISAGGNTALNQLGLSTQVPAGWVYISSGPYKTYEIGEVVIEFCHRSSNQIGGMSPNTMLMIQALKMLGRGNVSEDQIRQLRKKIPVEERAMVLNESQRTFSWIYEIIKEICEEGEN